MFSRNYISVLLFLSSVFLYLSLTDRFISQDLISEQKDTALVKKKIRKIFYPDDKKMHVAQKVTDILQFWHYKKLPITDSISESIYTNYLKVIDQGHYYLYKEDIAVFEKYKHQLDDALLRGNLLPFFELYNTYSKRYDERYKYCFKLLEQDFDFTKDEYYITDRGEYFENEKEANDFWRTRVKYDLLNLQLDTNDIARNKKILKERYENILNNSLQINENDIFQIIINCYTRALDPHSTYMVPNNAESFNIRQSLAYAGIGATLTTRNEIVEILNIMPNGPAGKDGILRVGDRIVGVGQGIEGAIINVIGWRIDDVVAKIRGEKETVVRLEVVPKGEKLSSEPQIVIVVRDVIILENSKPKASVVTQTVNGKEYKIGIIPLNSFYLDYKALQRGDKNYNSSSRDTKKQIDSLKRSGVQGFVLDLRNNGGGSLKEAIDLTGLFIDKGSVVQVKDVQNKIYTDEDKNPGLVWDGPLAVLINRNSASASEIFAGAIQDYKIGVIIGENTYGKGTVQQVIDLNRYIPQADGKAGQLNVTIAKFYRITGASTQFKGVTPDLSFPKPPNYKDIGEKSMDAALVWDSIDATFYRPENRVTNAMMSKFESIFGEDIDSHVEYRVMQENYNDYERYLKNHSDSLTLNLIKLTEEREKDKLKNLKMTNKYRKLRGFKPLQLHENPLKGETIDDLYKDVAVDILISWIDGKQQTLK